MSPLAGTLPRMDPSTSIVVIFAVLVMGALARLIIKGTAGFLFEAISQIAQGVFGAVVWLVRQVLRLVWWLVIGWWWRRWVSPTIR